LAKRRDTDLNVNDYCEHIGITRTAYYYWQRKLRERAALTLPVTNRFVPDGWVSAVSAVTEAPNSSRLTLKTGRFEITVDSGTDMQLLSKVCSALAALC